MSARADFAHALYLCRTNRGFNQSQVAELADLSVRQYRNLEIGRAEPQLSTAIRLARVLDLSLDALKAPTRS